MKKKIVLMCSMLICLFIFACQNKTSIATETETIPVVPIIQNTEPVIIKPLYTEVDMNNLPDGIYPVEFTKKDIQVSSGDQLKTIIKCKIFSEDYFDMIEMHMLKVGDELWHGAVKEKVEKVVWDKNHSKVCINYWDNVEDAEEVFVPQESGGIYKFEGLDGHSSYTNRGESTIILSKNCTFSDTFDFDNTKNFNGIEEVTKELVENEHDYFICLNTTIRIENGEAVEIIRKYIP